MPFAKRKCPIKKTKPYGNWPAYLDRLWKKVKATCYKVIYKKKHPLITKEIEIVD